MAENEREMPAYLLKERVQMYLDHIRLKKENGLLDPNDCKVRVTALKMLRKLFSFSRELEI
jgi:hypothetical protein